MNERTRKKRPCDLNLLAASIVDEAAGQEERGQKVEAGENPHSVALGRLGGKKGGKVR